MTAEGRENGSLWRKDAYNIDICILGTPQREPWEAHICRRQRAVWEVCEIAGSGKEWPYDLGKAGYRWKYGL